MDLKDCGLVSSWAAGIPLADKRLFRPSLRGPALLWILGLLLAPVAQAQGPYLLTLLSALLALFIAAALRYRFEAVDLHQLERWLHGLAWLLFPLGFVDSTLANRKSSPLNAWLFDTMAGRLEYFEVPPHPNGIGMIFLVACALSLPLAWPNRPASKISTALLGAATVALVLLHARASLLALLVLILVSLACRNRIGGQWPSPKLRPWLSLSPWILAVWLLVRHMPVQSGQPGLASLESLQLRLDLWRSSLGLLAESPWRGLGPGGLRAGLAQMTGSPLPLPHNAHNLLLQQWLDAGVCGFLASLWLGIRLLGPCRRALRPAEAEKAPAGLALAILGLASHGLFESSQSMVWNIAGGVYFLFNPLPFGLLGAFFAIAPGLQDSSEDAEQGRGGGIGADVRRSPAAIART